jgi:hypothetical protein
LQIVELEPSTPGGYLPTAGQGTLDQNDDTHWVYTAFDEPSPVVCENRVKVWIAAKYDDLELNRKSILVLPVHTFLTTGANANFLMDFNYISWKYAAVLATTGGAFAGPPTISTDVCVPCGGTCGAACTTIFDNVTFGTSAFTQSEHATASTIGHELVHTIGLLNQNECTSYTWEVNNAQQTGISQCDAAYLGDVEQRQDCHCDGINCP